MDKVVEIIWDASKSLCGCAKQEADYVFDLEHNLRSLKHKWKDLEDIENDVKANVDEHLRGAQLNTWLLRIQSIRKEIEDIQVQGPQEIQNKCVCKFCPKNFVSSYKLGKNVTKMLKTVDELITTGKSFNVEITHKVPPPRSIEFPADDIVGLDLMLEKVWNSIESHSVGIIGLYGMGGAGKTTLLKRINNEFRNRRHDFYFVLWVVVSRKPSFDNIMENIRNKVGIRDDIWKNYSNPDEKAAAIYQVLKQKKFVLLLDDIWERVDMKMVGVPHPKNTDFQSKVLFTTRSEDVCAKMQAQRRFKVECLTEKEALELFFLKVGEETLNSHSYIPKLARDMATECKGLPLALIIVGSAMAGVNSLEAWEHAKNNLMSSSWIASDLETKVFSILKFSYDQLPDESHRNCFLYCALYPEDYEIRVSDLIDKWIGEGFLGKDASIQDMFGHSESVIEKLKLSCLLESVESDSFEIKMIKMHDVVRDMTLWLMRDQGKNKKKILVGEDTFAKPQDDIEMWKNVERISIIENGGILHGPTVVCPNLISFTFKWNQKLITGFPNIQYMSRLKVLDLSGTFDIELLSKIGSLILLEYLSLKGHMRASWFPIELKNLKNLKYFSLSILGRSDIASIPSEVISNLEQLRWLRFYTNAVKEGGEEREFLEKLDSLLHLEALWIELKTENGLKKLLESTKLQSCMCSFTLRPKDTPINMPLLLASMSRMKHLHEICFLYLNVVEDSSIFDTCYLGMLRKVSISWCDSIVYLTWLKYAPLLEDLEIIGCKSLEIVIKGGTEDRENEDNIFSSLVRLHLRHLPKLKRIYKNSLPYPSLKYFDMFDCPNFVEAYICWIPTLIDKLKHILEDANHCWTGTNSTQNM